MNNKGFSIVEVLVAVGIAFIIFAGIMSLQSSTALMNKEISRDISYSQLISEVQLILKTPETCTDSLKNTDINQSVKIHRLGTSQGQVMIEKDMIYEGWRINDITFEDVFDLPTAGEKVATLRLDMTKQGGNAIQKTQDYLVKLKVDGANLVQNCFVESTANDICISMGGTYDVSADPKCNLPASKADMGACPDGQVMSGFDANGDKICRAVAGAPGPSPTVWKLRGRESLGVYGPYSGCPHLNPIYFAGQSCSPSGNICSIHMGRGWHDVFVCGQ